MRTNRHTMKKIRKIIWIAILGVHCLIGLFVFLALLLYDMSRKIAERLYDNSGMGIVVWYLRNRL